MLPKYGITAHLSPLSRFRRSPVLNDATVNGEAELVPGDLIRIGDTEFRFEPEGE